MSSRIVNLEHVAFEKSAEGERYAYEMAEVGQVLGSQKLGFNVTVIPPGKCAFPYHAHRVNEELFVVLEGRGSVRINGELHPIRTGDCICLPPGPESAHQFVNDSSLPLRYLAVSTMELPEIVEFPDSGKISVTAGTFPGAPTSPDSIRKIFRVADAVDYWRDEQ